MWENAGTINKWRGRCFWWVDKCTTCLHFLDRVPLCLTPCLTEELCQACPLLADKRHILSPSANRMRSFPVCGESDEQMRDLRRLSGRDKAWGSQRGRETNTEKGMYQVCPLLPKDLKEACNIGISISRSSIWLVQCPGSKKPPWTSPVSHREEVFVLVHLHQGTGGPLYWSIKPEDTFRMKEQSLTKCTQRNVIAQQVSSLSFIYIYWTLIYLRKKKKVKQHHLPVPVFPKCNQSCDLQKIEVKRLKEEGSGRWHTLSWRH